MFFTRKWWRITLNKLLKTKQSKWPDNVVQAAQLTSPVNIQIAPRTTNGVFPILVNGTDVVQAKSLEEAQIKIRVIKGFLRARGSVDIWEVEKMKLRYHEVFVSNESIFDIPDTGILDPPYLIMRGTPNHLVQRIAWFEIVERYGERAHGT